MEFFLIVCFEPFDGISRNLHYTTQNFTKIFPHFCQSFTVIKPFWYWKTTWGFKPMNLQFWFSYWMEYVCKSISFKTAKMYKRFSPLKCLTSFIDALSFNFISLADHHWRFLFSKISAQQQLLHTFLPFVRRELVDTNQNDFRPAQLVLNYWLEVGSRLRMTRLRLKAWSQN